MKTKNSSPSQTSLKKKKARVQDTSSSNVVSLELRRKNNRAEQASAELETTMRFAQSVVEW